MDQSELRRRKKKKCQAWGRNGHCGHKNAATATVVRRMQLAATGSREPLDKIAILGRNKSGCPAGTACTRPKPLQGERPPQRKDPPLRQWMKEGGHLASDKRDLLLTVREEQSLHTERALRMRESEGRRKKLPQR